MPGKYSQYKKVLTIMYHLPPLGGIPIMRSLRLIKYLSNFGWQPIILTSQHGFDLIGGKDEALVLKIPQELLLFRVSDPIGKLYDWSKSIIGKLGILQVERIAKLFWYPDDKLIWGLLAIKKMKRYFQNQSKPHLIYASGFPWSSFFVGIKLKQVLKVPLVLDFRDSWSLSPSPFWSKNRLHYLLEKWAIHSADVIIFSSNSTRKQYQKLYPNIAEKMATIHNGFDPDDFKLDLTIDESQGKSNNKIHKILYAGSLSDTVNVKDRSQSLVPFIHSIAEIKEKYPELFNKLRIDIYSNDLPNTKKLTKELGILKNFKFNPRISHEEIIKRFSKADILLLIVMRGQVAQQIVPAKLYEYIAAGKPILAISPPFSEASKIIEEFNLGIVVNYDNIPNGVVKAIQEIMLSDNWNRKNGRLHEARKAFNGINLVESFAKKFNSLNQET